MNMMNNEYPLQWLDSLVLHYFNPAKTDVSRLTEADLEVISQHIKLESARIQVRIKNEIFVLKRKRQIRLLVRKYHSTLIFLMDSMVENCKTISFQVQLLSCMGDSIIKCLDELLSFIENRYSVYLSLDDKAPISYLMVSRKEMQFKLKKINAQKKTVQKSADLEVLKLLADELSDLISLQDRSRVTFRQLLYQRTVLKELEELHVFESQTHDNDFFSELDCKLIGLNFNSRSYINLLRKRLAEKLKSKEDTVSKLSMLTYYLKEFYQIGFDGRLFLNADGQSLHTVIESWFKHEIQYHEKFMELASAGAESVVSDVKHENKLECDLSADQIGIILRAADEARIVKSRSMSLVFQRIVPHLSTAFKRDLSYQSVRSKSYNAEDNDKNIAILTLEKMIKKIRSY